MAFTSSPKPKSNASKLKRVRDAGLSSLGNLIKLLPTGTVFLFQFLNPILTNNGDCEDLNELISRLFIYVCGLSCAFSCITDSYIGSDGLVHYGMATFTGLWPASASELIDLSKYKLRGGDFVQALISTMVFMVSTMLDRNSIKCFYSSSFEKEHKMLLKALPPLIGAISSSMFMVFPSKRHGIGYPFSSYESEDEVASKEVE